MSACDERLAYYREAAGDKWDSADDTVFRIGWNEGAFERDRQLRAELENRATDDALASECRSLREQIAALRRVCDIDAQTCRDALAEVDRLRQVVDRIGEYADTFGKDLVPRGADSYGEGVRAVKGTVKTIIAKGLAK